MYTTTDQPDTSHAVAATDGRVRTTPTFGTAYVRGIPSWRWRAALQRQRVAATVPVAGSHGADQPTEARPSEPASRRRHHFIPRRRLGVRAPMAGFAVAALLAGSSLARGDESTGPSMAGGAPEATELDVRGVPVWWAEGPSVGGAAVVTELDVRGVPVWWAEGRASGDST